MSEVSIDRAMQIALQLHGIGKLADAEQIYRQVLVQQPARHDATRLLGIIASRTGRSDEAVMLLSQAASLAPDVSEYQNDLGIALRATGRVDEAVEAGRRAVRLRPENAEAHSNLGNCLVDQGKFDDAIASYRRAVKLKPGMPDLRRNLGMALIRQRNFTEAAAVLEKAVAVDPGSAETQNELGNAWVCLRRFADAAQAYRRAIAIRPDYARALNNLGNALSDQRLFDEAIGAYRQALQVHPDYLDALRNAARVFKELGLLDEAIAYFRRANETDPDHIATQDDLIISLNYSERSTPRSLYEEGIRWDRRHAEPLRRFIRPHSNPPDPQKRLRVGYVSPDLCAHPVGRFALSLLKHHTTDQFEIFCYSQVPEPDQLSARIRSCAGHWTDIKELSDDQVENLVREDGIDILVDLALHTAGNRLPVFARKPAPVQMTFAGYPGSTGLRTIDYRISDPHLDPPGMFDAEYSETTLCLPDTFWCDGAMDDSLETGDAPALRSGFVTFGSLNNFCKINEPVLACWSEILKQVDRSQLLLLAPDGSARDRIRDHFGRAGVDPARVQFTLFQPRDQYLNAYHEIDVVLDTWPYNGHATTFDALWMGVPVVTRLGNSPFGRAGLSQLTNVGLPELVASTPEEYVRIAVDLGRDPGRISRIRSSLRQRMKESPLTDAPEFARAIESLYRGAWRKWCAGR